MSSLFERLAGVTAGGTDPEGGKLPIHVFTSILLEFKEGRVSGAEARALLGLTTAQVQEVQWLIQAITASTNKMGFLRMIKDHFYLAEWKGTRDVYADEASFYTKLEQALLDEGVTPPQR